MSDEPDWMTRAKSLFAEGQSEEAEALLEATGAAARIAGDYLTEIAALCELATRFLRTDRAHQAVAPLELARRAAENLADPALHADVLFWLGRAHLAQGDPRTAETFFLRAATLREENPALHLLLGQSYLYLALAAAGCENFRSAITCNQKGLAWCTEQGRKELAAALSFNLGFDYFEVREFDTAVTWFTHARQTYQDLKQPKEAAEALYFAGRAHLDAGDLEKARDAFSQALLESHIVGDLEDMGYCYTGLAQTSLRRGDTFTAIGQFDNARVAFRDLNDVERTLTCYHWMEAAQANWKKPRTPRTP